MEVRRITQNRIRWRLKALFKKYGRLNETELKEFLIINKLRTMCKGWILDSVRTTQNKTESEKLFSSYNL